MDGASGPEKRRKCRNALNMLHFPRREKWNTCLKQVLTAASWYVGYWSISSAPLAPQNCVTFVLLFQVFSLFLPQSLTPEGAREQIFPLSHKSKQITVFITKVARSLSYLKTLNFSKNVFSSFQFNSEWGEGLCGGTMKPGMTKRDTQLGVCSNTGGKATKKNQKNQPHSLFSSLRVTHNFTHSLRQSKLKEQFTQKIKILPLSSQPHWKVGFHHAKSLSRALEQNGNIK